MQLDSIHIKNFKAFKNFRVNLSDMNILIGSNNSGKTTVITTLRLLSVALLYGSKNKPSVKEHKNKNYVYDIPKSKLPVSLESIQNDYHDEEDSYVEFIFENNAKLILHFPEAGSCSFTTDIEGNEINDPKKFRYYFPVNILQIPVLGPIEDDEKKVKEQTIINGMGTQRASRHFRNNWLLDDSRFNEFANLVKTTWIGMEIEKPEYNYMDNRITMYCREDSITREIYWVGYGFQIWCQILSYITRCDDYSVLVLDEPDIYLHSDLQKKLIEMIRNLGAQVILATHSTAILNEAKSNEVVLIDKNKNSSKRMKAPSGQDETSLSNEKLFELVVDNEEVIKSVIKSELRNEDLITIGYRRNQLNEFNKLLNNDSYFEKQKKILSSSEAVWQNFFEKNPWIFGYGLGYIFMSNLDNKKLEQVVKGYDFSSSGKRADAVMKTKGAISNLCFVEIKTHNTELLEKSQYRSGCWGQSKEITGGIAQVRITVDDALNNIYGQLKMDDEDGNPTGEELYNYKPKSFLIVGHLDQFRSENGVNKGKLRSFEIFRNNQKDVEIITFDELYERAKFIVDNS
ncbi:Shedu anti-phage system protein SduA domain-containing protein [Fusibacter tunisiensis]|uniref:Energy-coupling factor transporter ATP-binding protein EcfA2 n=1 Tax=Fusibacter tunisiensis TaxID=1008308 RepID=A0ABS2MT33_9FIRM|nr:Shedu anti-phage system protein SduA domain-containing protein [Fusibacter tunisiensis]MBM7562510.1 energy-coupling factor transporter ATP-binding protein EcfA2 [Fusibacter tunisiensis]